MAQVYLQNGLWCALIGAGVGSLVGVLKSIKETQWDPVKEQHQQQQTTNQSQPQSSFPQSHLNSGNHASNNNNRLNIFDTQQFPNIALDPVCQEALSQFQTYQPHIPNEFRTIAKNLDHLIGLQVAINNGKIEANYPYRATSFNTQILTALAVAKTKLRNVSTPHLDVDIESIEGIARDYMYNIGKDVDQHLLSRQG